MKADKASRKEYALDSEWQLDPVIFRQLQTTFGHFQIDLFATRVNTQCATYFAWKPDPQASGIDAFAQPWNYKLMYGFLPFSLIGRTLQRLEQEGRRAVLIVPFWPTQHWWGRLLRMTVDHPRLLPARATSLHLPQYPERVHPFLKRLHLTAFLVSGMPSEARAFRLRQPISSDMPGGTLPKCNTAHMSESGRTFVIEGRLIVCKFL